MSAGARRRRDGAARPGPPSGAAASSPRSSSRPSAWPSGTSSSTPETRTSRGTWAGSQALLGSSTLVVKHDGDSFRIKGLKIGGQAPTDVHVDDGRLYASGSAGGREWTVKFEIQADGRQMWAYYDAGDGQPEQRLRLTRVTD